MELNQVGIGPHDVRGWHAGSAPTLVDLAAHLSPPSPHFVLFLAMDCRYVSETLLLESARSLVETGTSYACCWGPGAKRLERCFDEAAARAELATPLNGPQDVVMTTSDEDAPLEEALWEAAWAAYPTKRFESTTRALVAVAIGNVEWSQRIAAYLHAGAPMQDEA